MRERLASVGGQLEIVSANGETRISAWIPLQHAVATEDDRDEVLVAEGA